MHIFGCRKAMPQPVSELNRALPTPARSLSCAGSGVGVTKPVEEGECR